MFVRILVPLDGSPAMAEVLPTLRQLVGGTGAAVYLLLVRPPVRGPVQVGDRLIYLDELLVQERATWRDYLVRQATQLAYDGIVVRRGVHFGDPLAETLAVAERHKVHLIALVAQRHSWPQCLFRPSLAQQLL